MRRGQISRRVLAVAAAGVLVAASLVAGRSAPAAPPDPVPADAVPGSAVPGSAGPGRPGPATTVHALALGSFAAPAAGSRSSVGQPAGVPIAPDALVGAAGLTLRRAPAHAPVLRTAAVRPAGFSAVGVSWAAQPAGGAVSVAVRTRAADPVSDSPASGSPGGERPGGESPARKDPASESPGGWSGWLTAAAEEAAVTRNGDHRVLRDGAELIWTGPAEGVEVVVTGLAGDVPSDLRVDLIDPGRGGAFAGPPPRRRAAGAVSAPPIRTRAQWGADESKMTWRAQYAPVLKAAVLHHTATSNAYRPADVPGIMRSIYQFQAVSRGWGDVGYNVLVDRFGQAWEGRAGGLSRPVIGAHAGGFNTGTFGVSMIGDFTGVAPPAATLETVARLLAWKYAQHGLNPRGSTTITGGPSTRYKTRVTITVPVLYPHKLTSVTACPGKYGEAALQRLRDRAAALIADPSSPVPPPAPTQPPTAAPTAVPTPTPEPTPAPTEPTPPEPAPTPPAPTPPAEPSLPSQPVPPSAPPVSDGPSDPVQAGRPQQGSPQQGRGR